MPREQADHEIKKQRSRRMSTATKHLLITSGVSIVVALVSSAGVIIAAYSDVAAATKGANTATNKAEKATVQAEIATRAAHKEFPAVPVGAIVASTLSWEDFSAASGSSADFSASRSFWAPCDGRSLSGSSISKAFKMHRAPDLRSVFLRGLNEFVQGSVLPVEAVRADPDESRVAGSYQADELRSHAHSLGYHKWGLANGKGDVNLERSKSIASEVTGSTGGLETRPKNVAVYYYIRIN